MSDEPARSPSAIVGTWALDADGDARTDVWLHLGDGAITGSTGCNHLRGRYSVRGDGVAIVGPVMTTLRGGSEAAMARERLVLTAVADGAPLQVDGEALVVGTGAAALSYLRITPSPDGTWAVTGIHRPDVEAIVSTGRAMSVAIDGSTATVTTPSGSVEGAVEVGAHDDAGGIAFDLDALPVAADEEDVALLDALARARSWRQEGSLLRLLRGDGGIAVTLSR